MQTESEREIFIINLRNTKKELNKLINDQQELNQIQSPPKLHWILNLLLWAFILGGLENLLKISERGNLVASIIFISYTSLYIYGLGKINKSLLEKKLSENKVRIEHLKEQINNSNQYLHKDSIVPQEYLYNEALDRFISYGINKRADSIKEAINLFEEETKHQQSIDELHELQDMQAATYLKVNEVEQTLKRKLR
ncbi:hypothetical protein [Peribacillus kribbensis]|uniref:hypothetical protein n=1 Tax=Peribacillus kribbensis TaxID=356658 RepID=UPI000478986B|nr:hypothetical protein [Peribacillus kribbensis]